MTKLGKLHEGMNVLIIEDDVSFRGVLEQIFSTNRRIRSTDSIAKAVEMAHEDPPDLCILDINLLDSRGMDTVRQIPNLLSDSTALVIMSGNATPEITKAALELGAVGVVSKPLRSFEDVVTRIKASLLPNRARFDMQINKLECLLGAKL